VVAITLNLPRPHIDQALADVLIAAEDGLDRWVVLQMAPAEQRVLGIRWSGQTRDFPSGLHRWHRDKLVARLRQTEAFRQRTSCALQRRHMPTERASRRLAIRGPLTLLSGTRAVAA
jgi:hypothetical protein